MDKTFSWSGIKKEAKRVRWPKKADVMSNTLESVIFTAFFAVFFVLCDLGITQLLSLMKIGG